MWSDLVGWSVGYMFNGTFSTNSYIMPQEYQINCVGPGRDN